MAAVPASAELADLRVGVDGARAEIAIVFDAAPTGASAAPGGGGIVVFASGVAASPRRIETAGGGLVRAVDVREGEGGVELDLALSTEAAAARSWVDGRTLRIVVTLAAPAGAAAQPPATSGAPAVAPGTPAATAATDATASAVDPTMTTPAATAPTDTLAASAAVEPSAPPVQGAISPEDAAAAAALTAPAPADAVFAPGLRLGGETTAPGAGSPEPSDGAAEAAGAARAPRDLGRPSVIYAGAVTEEECDAADTAVRADPWDLVSLKRYASCRAVDGDVAGAETAFRRLLTFTPDDPDAELGLAAVRHEQGAVAEAAAVYERLLADATGDAEAARLRALLALVVVGQ